MNLKNYQIISLIAGFLITFIFSSVYTLGTISPYLASYIHHTANPNINVVDLSILYPTFMVSQCFGITLSMIFLQKIIGYRFIAFIGIYGITFCTYVTSYLQNLNAYVFFYAFLYGVFAGISYMIPLLNCYTYLPNKKGLCSGICMTAFGIGAFVFNQIFLNQINPNDEDPNLHHIFSQEVALNVPNALRFISIIYFVIGTIGCLLIIPKSTLKSQIKMENMNHLQMVKKQSIDNQSITDESQSKDSRDNQLSKKQIQAEALKNQFKTNFIQLLKTKQYRILFIMIITSAPFGTFIAFNYKEYGQILGLSDDLITLTGSFGALSNSASKLIWCYLMDKYSFKQIIFVMNTTQIIYMILIIIVEDHRMYTFLIVLIYFSYGGIYGIYPTQTLKIYGDKDGSRIYPIVFTAFSLSSIIQFLFHFLFVKQMGDQGFIYCFMIFGILLIIAQIIFCKTQFKLKEEPSTVQQKFKQKL